MRIILTPVPTFHAWVALSRVTVTSWCILHLQQTMRHRSYCCEFLTFRWEFLTNHQRHLYLTLRRKKSLRCWYLFIHLLIKYVIILGTPLLLTEVWELIKDPCIWDLEIWFVIITCVLGFIHYNVFLLKTICVFWLNISI